MATDLITAPLSGCACKQVLLKRSAHSSGAAVEPCFLL